jgi:hypothetical protein
MSFCGYFANKRAARVIATKATHEIVVEFRASLKTVTFAFSIFTIAKNAAIADIDAHNSNNNNIQ